MIRRVTVIMLAVLPLLTFAQKKKRKDNHDVLFTVNGRPVMTSEFEYLYTKNNQNQGETTSSQKVQEYLDLFINFKLKVEEARQLGRDTSNAFISEFNSYKQELRKPYLPEAHMIDSLVQQTYKRLKEEVRASHLLIRVAADASPEDTLFAYNKIAALLKRARAGEDFAALVDTYSEDETARSNHGDLGYFTALQMVYPFETAAYSGKKGDIVGPVRTQFGYHLVKITDRIPARGEVEVAHIMLRTGKGQDDEQLKNQIFEIYDQLRGGVNWDDLCKKFSDDQSTKDSGGKLRPFGVGAMRSIPEFEQTAFSLEHPGDLSDPFQTAYGWHIMKLIRKIPLPELSEMEQSLRTRVSRGERVQISKQAAAASLRKKMGFKENDEVKKFVFSFADSTLTAGKWSAPMLKGTEKQILFSTQSGKFMPKDFIQYVIKVQKPSTQSPSQYMNKLYEEFVDEKVYEDFDAQISKQNPEYGHLLNEYYEGILLFDVMEDEVWNKASNDSIGQAKYFEEHKSDFKAGERIEAEIYASAGKDFLTPVKSAIASNDSVKVSETASSKNLRYERGVFQKADRPVLSKIDWKPGLYEVENGGMYYLVHVERMVPPGILTFAEARPAVISAYQEYLEKLWLQKLRKKYTVKINEAGKKYVFEKLGK